ncbi:hypothetical protein BDP27DRAFT_1432388 [Rhodocollybia butyracea]|uniref:Uncharacterized protein n=1 Tax=Rhodocollybia butyracea TaxID=206335 RepID=A0A9P5TYS7_9AGAR|nr:hypothetical protein BDP27DRAFT_1432388 [Rhodocollybia butyracea]
MLSLHGRISPRYSFPPSGIPVYPIYSSPLQVDDPGVNHIHISISIANINVQMFNAPIYVVFYSPVTTYYCPRASDPSSSQAVREGALRVDMATYGRGCRPAGHLNRAFTARSPREVLERLGELVSAKGMEETTENAP